MLPSRRAYIGNGMIIDRKLIAETGVIPVGLQLITDTFPFQVIDKKETVTEDVNGREVPVMRVTGLFQMGDKENANQRFYSTKDVLAPAVQSIQEDVSGRAVMGEYDHPADAKIHLDRVSHLITKIWMDGRKVFGEAEILHKLPLGACLRGLFEHKVRVGISSRGVGDMEVAENHGQQIYRVMPGYAFVTWDAVAEPSVSGAILNIQEGLNRRLNPIKKLRNQFTPETYNDLVVEQINDYFGLNKRGPKSGLNTRSLRTRS
jgi:hypothetical protein